MIASLQLLEPGSPMLAEPKPVARRVLKSIVVFSCEGVEVEDEKATSGSRDSSDFSELPLSGCFGKVPGGLFVVESALLPQLTGVE